MSRLCNHCAFCGCRGKHNKSIVTCVSQIMNKTTFFPLNKNTTCSEYGIYVATCVICHEQYVGQTSNKFSKIWSAQRSNWNKQDCKTDNDQMALSRHFSKSQGTINKPPLHDAYAVTVVKQPCFHSPSISEHKWYHQRDAHINMQNKISPTWNNSYHILVFFNVVQPSPSIVL